MWLTFLSSGRRKQPACHRDLRRGLWYRSGHGTQGRHM